MTLEIDEPSSWLPALAGNGTQYLAIAGAIERDIRSGKLKSGDRLPTHRQLAASLGISISTASKAYSEANRRKLIRSEVGRGTYVLPAPAIERSRYVLHEETGGLIDLGYNCPIIGPHHVRAMSTTLAGLAQSNQLADLLQYQRPYLGLLGHREAACRWLERQGVVTRPDDVVVVNGAQHGTAVTLLSMTKPGDVILTEELTDPGIKYLCSNIGLSLRGIAMDGEGLIPEAFEAECKETKIRGLICMPNHQSPTLAILPAARRAAIAAIAERYDVLLIENDVYGPLVSEHPAPLWSLAPHRTFYITSLSKVLVPGIRIGFLATPPGQARTVMPGLGTTSWMPSLVSAELAMNWLASETADKLVAWQRQELAKRNGMAREALGQLSFRSLESGLHVWVTLAPPWRAEAFLQEIRKAQVLAAGGEVFAVGHAPAPQAIRLSLGGAVSSEAELQKGFQIISEALKGRPQTVPTM